jgi:hypothetical protein
MENHGISQLLGHIFSLETFLSKLIWTLIFSGVGWLALRIRRAKANKKKDLWSALVWGLMFFIVAMLFSSGKSGSNPPNLNPQLEFANVGSVRIKSATNEVIAISFGLHIFNTGSPTITKDWRLEIITIGKELIPTAVFDSSHTVTTIALDDVNLALTPTNWIVGITARTPIPSGAMVSGHASFHLPDNVPRANIQLPGTIFRLSFKDVMDKTYTLDYPVSSMVVKSH